MKVRKKLRDTRNNIWRQKKRRQHAALSVAVLVIIIFLIPFIINLIARQPSENELVGSTSAPKAAIVDHLSLTFPNQTFILATTNTLRQSGYAVDYYPNENVTVEFYRKLPSHDYDVIILRAHSSATAAAGEREYPVHFWTSELYSTSEHIYEQLTDQLGVVTPFNEEKRFFAIGPQFVRMSMKGTFENTIIIAMGCDGLRNTEMAKAFIEKGAKVYISWDKLVLASHTDVATARLLQNFLIHRQTIRIAVERTMQETGADPACNSLLLYYPPEAGNYTLPSIIGNIISSSIEISTQSVVCKEKNQLYLIVS